MAIITSADSVVSVTVTVTQDPDGVYAIQVSNITAPSGTPLAVEYNGGRVYQENAANTSQGDQG